MSIAPFDRLGALPTNWDSYGAAPIGPAVIQRARDWLAGVSVVPMSSGGVQLEWHAEGHDVEIAFLPDGTMEAFAEPAPPLAAPDAR